jgi:hypothetical protein
LNEATDAWALGAVLYKAATGQRPSSPHRGKQAQAASVRSLRRLPERFLGSVSIVAASRRLLLLGIGLGTLATLLMLNGFLLLVDLPFG